MNDTHAAQMLTTGTNPADPSNWITLTTGTLHEAIDAAVDARTFGYRLRLVDLNSRYGADLRRRLSRAFG